jgi:hypothetical protein
MEPFYIDNVSCPWKTQHEVRRKLRQVRMYTDRNGESSTRSKLAHFSEQPANIRMRVICPIPACSTMAQQASEGQQNYYIGYAG